MTTSSFLPTLFLASALSLSGGVAATAQTLDPGDAPAVQVRDRDDRGAHGDRDGHGGRAMGGWFAPFLTEIDTDGDGGISQPELDAFRAAQVAAADTSGDGAISLDEFATIYLEMTRDRMVDGFQALDADGDGALTQEEMDARFGDIVARMDRNDDGTLDRDDRGHP